ncbi:ABC-type transport system involved in cytochrome bd biosynthesis fused ATPase/permease subunit [Kribbella italica]|uniref:ABC-type transport system involved in cytochrome bd biosynthesis fused ATPase/permease subunit n=1 Tax=Kribbella italica TaxID=1540520 RepID=A0A7W9J1R6_9ACTN|nr:ABC-type transport system involved in cytochrome bd biosynthesis fused ATPase/permease subunit [Kribbella italica]
MLILAQVLVSVAGLLLLVLSGWLIDQVLK